MEGFAEPAARNARPDLDGQESDGSVERLLESHPTGIPPNAVAQTRQASGEAHRDHTIDP
jgi:hypothetical protein